MLEDVLDSLSGLLANKQGRGTPPWAAEVCSVSRDAMHFIVIAPPGQEDMKRAEDLFQKALDLIDPDHPAMGKRHRNIRMRLTNLRHLMAGEPLEQFRPENAGDCMPVPGGV